MTQRWVFISHPNVVIDLAIPVTRWPPSDLGRARMRAGLRPPWVRDVQSGWQPSNQEAA